MRHASVSSIISTNVSEKSLVKINKRSSAIQLSSPTKQKVEQDLSEQIKLIDPFQAHIKDKDTLEILIQIMRKHPMKRQEVQLNFMEQIFIEEVKFFKDISNEIPPEQMKNLMRHLNYEFQQENQTLFQIGDIGDKFYILLSGHLYVLREQDMTKQEQERLPSSPQNHPKKIKLLKKNSRINCSKQGIEDEKSEFFDEVVQENIKDKIQRENPNLEIVFDINQGVSFGEIALRTAEGQRTGTIITSEDSHLAILTSGTYFKIISKYHDKIFQEQIEFIKKISIFSEASRTLCHEILNAAKLTNFQRGEVIYQPDDENQYLYLIQEGEIQIHLESTYYKEHILEKKVDPKIIDCSVVFQQILNKNQKKVTPFIKIGENELFGQYDIFKQNKRISYAICSTDCQIFIIKSNVLLRSLWDKSVKKNIQNLFKERDEYIKRMVEMKEKNSFKFDYLPFLHQQSTENDSQQTKLQTQLLQDKIQAKIFRSPNIDSPQKQENSSNNNNNNNSSPQKEMKKTVLSDRNFEENQLFKKLQQSRSQRVLDKEKVLRQINLNTSDQQIDEVISSIKSNHNRRNVLSNYTQDTNFIEKELLQYQYEQLNYHQKLITIPYKQHFVYQYEELRDNYNKSKINIENIINDSFCQNDILSTRSNSMILGQTPQSLDKKNSKSNSHKNSFVTFNTPPDLEQKEKFNSNIYENDSLSPELDKIQQILNFGNENNSFHKKYFDNQTEGEAISPLIKSIMSPQEWLEKQIRKNRTKATNNLVIHSQKKIIDNSSSNSNGVSAVSPFPSFSSNLSLSQILKKREKSKEKAQQPFQTKRVLQIYQPKEEL